MTIYLNKCTPYILIRDLMEQHDVVVIGAGPAGLFCALHAALPGHRILLLEKNPDPGAKLLLSGSGQCNITHSG
jgi:predicted flavoprotein YhiN